MAKKKAKKSAPRASRKKSAFDEFEENQLDSAIPPGRAEDDELADVDFGDEQPVKRQPAPSPPPAVSSRGRKIGDDGPSGDVDDEFDTDLDDDADVLDDDFDDRPNGDLDDASSDDLVDDDDDDEAEGRRGARGADVRGRVGPRTDERSAKRGDPATDDDSRRSSRSPRPVGQRRPLGRNDRSQERPAGRGGGGRGDPVRGERGRQPDRSASDRGGRTGEESRSYWSSGADADSEELPLGADGTGDRSLSDGDSARDLRLRDDYPREDASRDEQRGARGRDVSRDSSRQRPKGPRSQERGDEAYREPPTRASAEGRMDDLEAALDDAFGDLNDSPRREPPRWSRFSGEPGSEPTDDRQVEDAAPEPPQVFEPDDPSALAALRKLGARLDLTPDGHVWRVILYGRQSRDGALAHVRGLPALRDLWVIGTAVTREGVDALKSEMPNIKIYG